MCPLAWGKLQNPREEMNAQESKQMRLQRDTVTSQSLSTAMEAAAVMPFTSVDPAT